MKPLLFKAMLLSAVFVFGGLLFANAGETDAAALAAHQTTINYQHYSGTLYHASGSSHTEHPANHVTLHLYH